MCVDDNSADELCTLCSARGLARLATDARFVTPPRMPVLLSHATMLRRDLRLRVPQI